MPNPTLNRFQKKTGQTNLLASLDKLSLSELNSLLMEVFRLKTTQLSPKDLMRSYRTNRFVSPSSISPIPFLESELHLLKVAERHGFTVNEYSPLAPLGNCSVIALADQNKIISALRGTEVVADITNVMALDAATKRVSSGFDKTVAHLCATHRHVRTQPFPPGKGFSAHFKIFCAVTAGKDSGNFEFEKEALGKHVKLYQDYLVNELKLTGVKIIIKSLNQEGKENRLAEACWSALSPLKDPTLSQVDVPYKDHAYYRGVRFRINLDYKGTEYNIGDGGFVDWSEKLTGNKKERMLTSGIGTEMLFKVVSGLVG